MGLEAEFLNWNRKGIAAADTFAVFPRVVWSEALFSMVQDSSNDGLSPRIYCSIVNCKGRMPVCVRRLIAVQRIGTMSPRAHEMYPSRDEAAGREEFVETIDSAALAERGGTAATQDSGGTLSRRAEAATDEKSVPEKPKASEEIVIEEISIDGMCGVY